MYKKNPRILILGVRGMLGRTVYNYFRDHFPKNTWGTEKDVKNNNYLYRLNANNHEKDFKNLFNKIEKINYVINCIGILDQKKPPDELAFINSLFPHVLERYAEKYKFNLIHVSSDAVFPKLSGNVNEKSKPLPEDLYGMSKLLGETSSQKAITIRSSFLGFNPEKRTGLLELINQQLDKKNKGYTNQAWSGCTTLQFATLCEWIIVHHQFAKIRKFSKIIHFAPLKSTKYNVLKNYLSLLNNNYFLRKAKATKITRYLSSNYFDIKMLKMYNTNIQDALVKLISFENDIAYKKQA